MLLDKNKLKSLRAQRGWTQQHLADVCDINIRTIQRLEKSGVASSETTKALASGLDLRVSDILLDQVGSHTSDSATKTDYRWVALLTLVLGFVVGYWAG
ncbi:MAG: helix-turn-helix domain-containing protein [Proteobacteria bacterium]|jgi:transcriptional regulator with XRE-family HTH domain|nr:helix-turn-helix domain-containing protein [Pseudomonadota bacterium]